MRNFIRLAEGVDVFPVLNAVHRLDLWKKDVRTQFEGSPFRETEEIILRFFPWDETTNLDNVPQQLETQFTEAWGRLPELRPVLLDLMRRVGAYSLERVFISRLAPGGRILPHSDTRGPYANLPDLARYHVVLQGRPGSLFRCGDETVQMKTGDVWGFNARIEHEVINNSDDDRIHLLADMRLM